MNKTTLFTCAIVLTMAAPVLGQVKRNELSYRAMVINGPKPVYPGALAARRVSGVAVASILVDADGKMQTVVVLDAPDPLIADAVRTALQRWTFRPQLAGPSPEQVRPTAVTSKLTFYFHVRNGAGLVLNPSEMPGGRPVPGIPTSVGRAGAPPPPPSPPAVRRDGHDLSHLDIDKAEFDKRLGAGATVVDARTRDAFRRGHHPQAINIPQDELQVRASIEIPAGKQIVVDCSQMEDFVCMASAFPLTELGFSIGIYRR